MNQKYFEIILLVVLCTGCGVQVDVKGAGTPAALIITSTLPPSLTPPPSQTPLPPPPQPTVVPVEGVASTQVNVRSEPSTASEVLGILPPESRVQIIGKDPGENWWQIQYPPGRDGKAWVAVEFIRKSETGEVPVVGGDEGNPQSGVTAIIQQQLNIRSGPGTDFNSVGTLNPQDVVNLTGKDENSVWLQIEFTAGPEGKGWINAAFVQVTGIENLPIVTSGNVIVGTGTPTNIPPLSAPTVIPAPADGDSAVSPAVNITLSASGTSLFQYSSDVSSPDGDTEDWIQFTTFTQITLIELDCSGSESYVAELLQNNSVTQTLVCEKIILVSTSPDAVYAVHFQSSPTGGLQYTRFTLRVESVP